MSDVRPIDYLVSGVLDALYAHHKDSTSHSLTVEDLKKTFELHFGRSVEQDHLELAIRRLEHEGVFDLIVDPYADTIIETSDKRIADFAPIGGSVIRRGWENESWLKSAFSNEKLWNDIGSGADLVAVSDPIPSSDGFVSIDHNSAPYREAESAVAAADDALRGDNEFADDEKGWIRSHIKAGLGLLRRGGPVLRSAILSLIVEPLKAAAKAAANDHAKSLIAAALAALRLWLGF